MGLNQVLIRNFQSIKAADLELGSFTVIVGPSSSGKSALIRAFKALASNVRGTSMITRGQKYLLISARTDAGALVTLERNERSGTYRLVTSEGEKAFTKLAGDVPAQITESLRIEPVLSESVNFAAQFDKPYLLDESGAVVARQLGELTNVNLIFEAVRQANRVRAHAASTLKTRKSDLQTVRGRVAQYQDLPQRLRLLAEADAADQARRQLTGQLQSIGNAIRLLRAAEDAAAQYQDRPVPEADDLNALSQRLQELRETTERLDAAEERAVQLSEALGIAQRTADQAESSFHQALRAAGVCPTCGQSTC